MICLPYFKLKPIRKLLKSQLLFSRSASPTAKHLAISNLNIHNTVNHFTYLGAHLSTKHTSADDIWNPVIKKIQTRISDWKGLTPYQARQNVLIHMICSSLPNYWLPHQKIYTKTKNSMQHHLSQVLWKGTINQNRVLSPNHGTQLPYLGI